MAEYAKEIVDRLSADLTERFGRGFGRSNLNAIRCSPVTLSRTFCSRSVKARGERVEWAWFAIVGDEGVA